jgi:Domain of unknown function (DUF5655)
MRECFHCRQLIDEGEPHDCWTTTEAVLTRDLSDDLQEAWERLRETAVDFGDQRIYASHHSIMFSRRTCYFFVRPKPSYLEVVFFLGRTVRSPKVRNAVQSSRLRTAHVVRIIHRDEVEAPLTDWLREAYHLEDTKTRKTRRARRREKGGEGARGQGARGQGSRVVRASRRSR